MCQDAKGNLRVITDLHKKKESMQNGDHLWVEEELYFSSLLVLIWIEEVDPEPWILNAYQLTSAVIRWLQKYSF